MGDYILSPQICVERKGISDLFQSFNSGRLYTQCEAMSKYYKYPCLLIEFDIDTPRMSLQSVADISADSIQLSNICSKLSILALSFPNLRILWSKSAICTADIFRAVMSQREPVDVSRAVAMGTAASATAASGSTVGETESNLQEREELLEREREENEREKRENARMAARAILLSLPGVNANNLRALMNASNSVAELMQMTESQLTDIIGSANARKLYKFCRQRIPRN